MIRVTDLNERLKELLERPQFLQVDLTNKVQDIFSDVINKGDEALFYYSNLFDGFNKKVLRVEESILLDSYNQLDIELRNAVVEAKENISKFHQAQIKEDIKVETSIGVFCEQKVVPIERVGLYIPGGTAPLFSTILMLAIPAKLAGCKEIVLCSPPNNAGGIHSTILAVAYMCGIKEVYQVGGSQAIAALTLGTESIKKVHKIFGPGNQYVTAAKQLATKYGVAIDMPAGPSEVLVYADESCNPAFVASDLLSQAEHGTDSHVVCVVSSKLLVDPILEQIEKQIVLLPRKELARETLKNSCIVVESNTDQAFEYINEYAPEHLIIASEQPDKYVDLIVNAGSVFLGNFTPESAGDYASGTNHTLPTYGWAKSFSGVNIDSFTKKITYQQITKDGILKLGNTIITMAEGEQLKAHANAVRLRMQYLN
jgi:histidinol dehydrogenase